MCVCGGRRCAFSVRLCVSTDALFVDGVVGVPQQDVGETGLQQVHGQERGLLHNLKQNRGVNSARPSRSGPLTSPVRCGLTEHSCEHGSTREADWNHQKKGVELQVPPAECCCTRHLFHVLYVAICDRPIKAGLGRTFLISRFLQPCIASPRPSRIIMYVTSQLAVDSY